MIKDYKRDLFLFFQTIKKLKISKVKVFTIFTLMILSSVLQLANPMFFGNIINGIVSKSLDSIKFNIILMFLFFIISSILNYITTIMSVKVGYGLELKIKDDVFGSILKIPYSKFIKIDKGKLINTVENDAAIFSGLFSQNLSLTIQAVNMIISFSFMIFISPLLTVILLLTFPITGIMYIYSGRKIKARENEYRKKRDKFSSFLYESIYGLKFLKIFNAEHKRNSIFNRKLEDINNLQIKKYKIEMVSQMFTSVVSFLINVLNISIAIYLIFTGRLSLGMLTAFNEYSDSFKNILLMFSKLNFTIQQIAVSITRVNDILQYKTENVINKNKDSNYKIGKIKIKNLYYSTPDNIEILNDVNLEFCKGNIYIIRGESGTGKTTLLNLLISFNEDYRGEILLNDTPLKKMDKKTLRKRISYITQDNYLFSMSIKENILLYRDIEFETIENICKRLNIHDTIMALPHKYDTIINKNGSDLSGGQRQRLCIARAIVSRADVYLFDEITSAIDKKNIEEIVQIIEEISNDSIVIITSHEELKFKVPVLEYNLIDKNFEIDIKDSIQVSL
ncbi:TPA: ABC transporter ATP-binding protein [Clostridioides difficile]